MQCSTAREQTAAPEYTPVTSTSLIILEEAGCVAMEMCYIKL